MTRRESLPTEQGTRGRRVHTDSCVSSGNVRGGTPEVQSNQKEKERAFVCQSCNLNLLVPTNATTKLDNLSNLIAHSRVAKTFEQPSNPQDQHLQRFPQ